MNSYFYKQVVKHQNDTLNRLKERFGIEITGAEKLNLILKLAVIPSAEQLQEKLDVHLGALVDGLDAQTTEIVIATNQAPEVNHAAYGYSFRSTNGFSLHTSIEENGTRHCSLVNSHGSILMNLDDALEEPSGRKMGEILRAMQLDAISASYNATLGSDPRKSSVIALQAVELKRFLEYKEIELDSEGMAQILAEINGAPDLDSFVQRSGINLVAAFEDIREGIVEGAQAANNSSKYFFIHANSLVPSVSVVDFDENGDVAKLKIRTLDGVEESLVDSSEYPTLFSFVAKMANDMRGMEFNNMQAISDFYTSLAEDEFDDDGDWEHDDDDVYTPHQATVPAAALQNEAAETAQNTSEGSEISGQIDESVSASDSSPPAVEAEPQAEIPDASSEIKKNLFKPAGRFGF